jgi:hypothetical protein
MFPVNIRVAVPLAVAGALAVAAVVTGGQVLAESTPPKPKPPFPQPAHGVSEAQAQAVQVQALKQFVAQAHDPRSLRRVEIGNYYHAPSTLKEAVGAADAFVVGRIQQTTFADNPSGGLPLARSRVQVDQVIKGNPGAELALLQLGGPMLTTTGLALVQLESDALLLPGDEGVLLLTYDPDHQAFRTIHGAGSILIASGQAVPEESNHFGASLAGKSRAEVLAAVSREARSA